MAADHVRRRYGMLLVEFGGRRTRVTVEAQTRRDAFAAAIKASRDADNLHAVELLSDDRRKVRPMQRFGGVPYVRPDQEPAPLYDGTEDRVRPYELSVEVFGDVQGAEYLWAPSRAEALREAVFLEGDSDNVQRVVLVAIGKTRLDSGGFWFVDETLPYGGVTGDLHGEDMDAIEEAEPSVPTPALAPAPWLDATDDLCPDGEPHQWSPEWQSTEPGSDLGHDGQEYRSACRRCRYVLRYRVEGATNSILQNGKFYYTRSNDIPWGDDPEVSAGG